MEKVRGDTFAAPIWDEYESITGEEPQMLERIEFYERAKKLMP